MIAIENVLYPPPMYSTSDVTKTVAVFLAGMVLPMALSNAFSDVIQLYLSAPQFTGVVAVAFWLLFWVFLATFEPDRQDVFLGSLIFPWIIGIGMMFVLVSTGGAGGTAVPFGTMEGFATYVASFVGVGLVAIATHRRSDRLSRTYEAIPSSRSMAISVTIFVVVAAITLGGVQHATARSSTISDVEPGVVEHNTPVLNVTLEGKPAEVRLTVTDPADHSYTTRIPRDARTDGSTTVPVEFYYLDGRPMAGTYRVEIRSITGAPVDSTTHTIRVAPTPSLRSIETAGPGSDLELDLPPNATEYRPSPGPTDPETRVGVVLQNEGDVASHFGTRILVGEDKVVSRDIFIEAGGTGGNVLAISDEDVDRIHEEANGTVVIEVGYGDDRETEIVSIPEG